MDLRFSNRTVSGLDISLLVLQDRKDQAKRAMTIEERTKRSLAKGEALLAQARIADRLARS